MVFYRRVPSQITLHFDQLVFKEEPVQPVYVNIPPAYRIASQEFSPTQVRIRGSQDRVQAINQVKTDPHGLERRHRGEDLSHALECRRSAGKASGRAGRYHSAGEARKDRERGCPLVARALFGTDGIRGVAGQAPLDPKTAQAVGAALGRWVIESEAGRAREVVIGMDTRESGPWLAAEVAAGLARHQVTGRIRGRHHHTRRRLPRQERAVRGRRDDFGVAQSVSG